MNPSNEHQSRRFPNFEAAVQSRLLPIALLASILILFAALRVRAIWESTPALFPDSYGYLAISEFSLSNPELYTGSRGFTVPLLYKLASSQPQTILFLQVILGVIAWGLLALSTRKRISTTWLGYLSVVLILAFALGRQVLIWDTAILSESISMSLLALALAIAFHLTNSSTKVTLAAFFLVTMLFAFARDSNAWLLGIGSLPVLASATIRRYRPHALPVGLLLLTISIISIATSMLGQRGSLPLLNIYGQRILPRPDRVEYFAELGMPLSVPLEGTAGEWASTLASSQEPEIIKFTLWVRDEGLLTYARFLLTHPSVLFGEPLLNRDQLLAGGEYSFVLPDGFMSPPLWQRLTDITYTKDLTLFILWVGTIFILAVNIAGWKHSVKRLALPLLLLAISGPLAALVWHADAMEVERHATQVGIQFHLALWLILLLSMDLALTVNRSPTESL